MTILQQLTGSVSAPESPYGIPADGPAADGAGPAPAPEKAPAEQTPASEQPPSTQAEPTGQGAEEKPPTEKPVEPSKPEDARDAALRGLAKERNETRRQLRQVQAELATLRTALESKPAAEQAPPVPTTPIVFSEPDPLEAYLASVGNDPDAAIPAAKMKEHAAWMERKFAADLAERDRKTALDRQTQDQQRRQQELRATESARQVEYNRVYQELAEGELSEGVLGEGLGIDDVHELAGDYLTPADRDWIRQVGTKDGPKAMWHAYYEMCFARAPRGSTAGQLLHARATASIARHKAPSPAAPSAPAAPNASKTKQEAPTREQILPPKSPGANVLRRMGFKI